MIDLVFMRFPRRNVLVLAILSALLSACTQFSGVDTGSGATAVSVQTIPPATLTAISEAAAGGTPLPDPLGIPWSELNGLELEFWYIWDLDQPGTGMNAIVDRFNQENEWGIRITAVDQGLVIDPLTSIETAFEEELVPNLLISDSSAIAGWYQEGLTVDLAPFVNDPAAGFSPQEINSIYGGIWENFWLADAVLPGLPFSQTVQAIYYNQSWAKELGYSASPETMEDYLEQACAAAASFAPGTGSRFQGSGILLAPEPANIWSSLSAHSAEVFDFDTGFEFTLPEAVQMAENWTAPILEGCGTLLYAYPDPLADELVFENFNRREAIMVMGPSRMMDHVHTEANRTGRADDWLMLPFPGPDGKKVVTAEVQAGVIFNTTPAEELASWIFLKYLVSPEIQAEWAQYSGDYPANKSSLRFLRAYRDQYPDWSQGLSLLKYAVPEPLDPSWNTIQLALGDAFEEMLGDTELDIEDQLMKLDLIAAELWEYSQRQSR